jgi:hypothetical protein
VLCRCSIHWIPISQRLQVTDARLTQAGVLRSACCANMDDSNGLNVRKKATPKEGVGGGREKGWEKLGIRPHVLIGKALVQSGGVTYKAARSGNR